MAPLLSLLAFAASALFATTAASPHIARHALDRRHHPIVPRVHLDEPVRRRSLDRRCASSPSNATSLTNATTSLLPSASAPATSPIPSANYSLPSTTSSTPSSTPPPPTTPAAPESTSAAPTTTSSPPPPPTTSTPPPPATTSTPPATTSAPPPAQTSASSSNSAAPSYLTSLNSGDGTWFDVGLGACGQTNNNNQNIVAISHDIFDTFPGYDGVNPNTNPVCGMSITVNYGGLEVDVTVVDRCVGCNELDLDLAPNAFSALTSLGVGRIGITWKFT